MTPALIALALRCLGPGDDADVLAPAIVQAVESRARAGLAPVTESPTLDVCLVATFARHESGARVIPAPVSWDARAGRSCGALQQDCARITGWSLRHQAAAWLHDAASGGVAGICGSGEAAARIAATRLEEARAALRGALRGGARLT